MYQSCLPEVFYPQSESTKKRSMSILSYAKSSLTLGELALICSHRFVFQSIVNDSSIAESDFSLVLEDDAKLHWKVVDPVC